MYVAALFCQYPPIPANLPASEMLRFVKLYSFTYQTLAVLNVSGLMCDAGFCGANTLHKTISTTFFLYFACILPAIAFGVLNYNNTGGQIGNDTSLLRLILLADVALFYSRPPTEVYFTYFKTITSPTSMYFIYKLVKVTVYTSQNSHIFASQCNRFPFVGYKPN